MPSSVLRPYNDASDGLYVPLLLKAKYATWIPTSNQLFLLHPVVLSLLVVSTSAAAYYVNTLFQTVLTIPGESLVPEDEGTWMDSIAAGIYVIPAIAAVVGALFALAYWYHARLWTRYADRETRKADVADILTYYQHPTSKFWCLEYDNQIVAAWGVDGRNPARPLQVIDEARIPKSEPTADETLQSQEAPSTTALQSKPSNNQEDDDEYDLALFRHSSTTTATSQDNTATSLTALASLESAKAAEPILEPADLEPAGPSLLPSSSTSSIKDASSLAEIRHLTLSDTYKPTKGVEGHILAIAVQSAFTTSEQIKHVIIRLDPMLEKPFRTHALLGGFRIIRNDVPLETGLGRKSYKDMLESIARRLWPLGYESEILMLDRDKWQLPRA